MRCAGCGKSPDQCRYPLEENQSAEEFVRAEEGTYDRATGRFLCDSCYIRFGMPSSPRGWTATPENLARLGL